MRLSPNQARVAQSLVLNRRQSWSYWREYFPGGSRTLEHMLLHGLIERTGKDGIALTARGQERLKEHQFHLEVWRNRRGW